MTDAGEVFLGIIAFAVLVMAFIQVAAVVAGLRVAKRVEQLASQIDHDIKPLIANLTAVSSDAARTAALASKQAERLDQAMGEIAERVTQTMNIAQDFVAGPARQGMAVVAGVRAVIDAFAGIREASRRRRATRPPADDDESLFIG